MIIPCRTPIPDLALYNSVTSWEKKTTKTDNERQEQNTGKHLKKEILRKKMLSHTPYTLLKTVSADIIVRDFGDGDRVVSKTQT